MEAEDVEKIFDLKLEILYGKLTTEMEKLDSKLNLAIYEVNKVDTRLDKQVAIWKWVLGIFSAILVPIVVAVIVALIL